MSTHTYTSLKVKQSALDDIREALEIEGPDYALHYCQVTEGKLLIHLPDIALVPIR